MESSNLSPVFQLIVQDNEESNRSFLGGLPKFPAEFEWPSWDATPLYLDEIEDCKKRREEWIQSTGQKSWEASPWPGRMHTIKQKLQDPITPLIFLGQIFLDEVPSYAEFTDFPDLPASGALCFFYDLLNFPPGFRAASKGSCKVIYLEDTSNLATTQPPARVADILRFVYGEEHYNSCPISFRPGWTRSRFEQKITEPSTDIEQLSENTLNQFPSPKESKILLGGHQYNGEPMHLLLGYPWIIQNLMEEMCQLCFHGFDELRRNIYTDPEVSHLQAGVKDWQLLLQLDCDRALNWEWGDSGRLYFWIRKQDLAKRDFSNIWCEMQCS